MMTITETQEELAQLRRELAHMSPPYLLRKYEATDEDFEQLADEDLRCEFLDGVLIVHSPATFEHENRVMFVSTLLNNFVRRHSLGWVCGSNTVVQLGDRRFCPDISFLSADHADRIRQGRVMGPMDLVVEVISRSTRDYDLGEKRNAYREGQIPEIWLFDYELKRCCVDVLTGQRYRSKVLNRGRFASRVLSGLSVDVAWVWSDKPLDPLKCLEIR
jgi:Uma2 family endonuclease